MSTVTYDVFPFEGSVGFKVLDQTGEREMKPSSRS